jgi:phosphatidylglycerol:prolipoprotein diacylglycerol transferase
MGDADGVTPAYVAVMLASVVAGALVSRLTRAQQPAGLSRLQRAGLLTGALVGGTFFAKLPYLFTDLDALISGRAWLEGGRTLTLGLVGGYLGVEVAKRVGGVRAKTGDGFGVRFHDDVPRHPTQLYEAVFHFGAAAALVALGRSGRCPRQRIKLYYLAYFAYRFVTEWIRPEPRLALGLTLYQWISLAAIALFGTLYAYDGRRHAAPVAG